MSPRKDARAAARRHTAPLFADAGIDPELDRAAQLAALHAQRIFAGPPEEELAPARVAAGIDEAGLGPVLGPMAIGYSAFRVPAADCNLWRALRAVCSQTVGDDLERLIVADSKQVFTRDARGERRLERTALAFLALGAAEKRCPPTARRVLESMARDLHDNADALGSEAAAFASDETLEPWCCELEREVPQHGERNEIEALVAALARELDRAEIEVVRAGVRLVHVRDLNGSFAETSNKAATHWLATRRLLAHLWLAHAHEGLELTVDRHGGRMYYAGLLAETFPGASIHVVGERPPCSEYVVIERADGAPARRMRITFAERAESRAFAVALASCLAKYARETCMNAFNAYFGGLQPGLRPTAGYTTDGWRWLADAGPAIERSGLPRRHLVRER
jgi:hypothetical protein